MVFACFLLQHSYSQQVFYCSEKSVAVFVHCFDWQCLLLWFGSFDDCYCRRVAYFIGFHMMLFLFILRSLFYSIANVFAGQNISPLRLRTHISVSLTVYSYCWCWMHYELLQSCLYVDVIFMSGCPVFEFVSWFVFPIIQWNIKLRTVVVVEAVLLVDDMSFW